MMNSAFLNLKIKIVFLKFKIFLRKKKTRLWISSWRWFSVFRKENHDDFGLGFGMNESIEYSSIVAVY